jgi:hypothetical protein
VVIRKRINKHSIVSGAAVVGLAEALTRVFSIGVFWVFSKMFPYADVTIVGAVDLMSGAATTWIPHTLLSVAIWAGVVREVVAGTFQVLSPGWFSPFASAAYSIAVAFPLAFVVSVVVVLLASRSFQ